MNVKAALSTHEWSERPDRCVCCWQWCPRCRRCQCQIETLVRGKKPATCDEITNYAPADAG